MKPYNKEESCNNCPDRCADPNCHDTCEYHIKRQKKQAIQNANRRKNAEFSAYKIKTIDYTKKQMKYGNLHSIRKG